MVITRKELKHESVRIKRIVLDLHGVIVDSRMVVLFEYMNSLFNLELETGRAVIQNMEAICWTQSATMSRTLQMLENLRGPVTD